MKNWYYVIWADAIHNIRKNQPKDATWKLKIFFYISWAHAVNTWMIFAWLKHLDLFVLPKFQLTVFAANMLNGAINFFIEFALVFFLLNYFLIFHKRKYEKVLQKYPETQIKYSMIYSFFIFIGALVSAILMGVGVK